MDRGFTDLWRSADKVVFSKTLTSVSSGRTTLEQDFKAEPIRHMKANADRNLTVGGADLRLHKRLRRGWWMSVTCSSGLSCWGVESTLYRCAPASASSSSVRSGLKAESHTSTTESTTENSSGGTEFLAEPDENAFRLAEGSKADKRARTAPPRC